MRRPLFLLLVPPPLDSNELTAPVFPPSFRLSFLPPGEGSPPTIGRPPRPLPSTRQRPRGGRRPVRVRKRHRQDDGEGGRKMARKRHREESSCNLGTSRFTKNGESSIQGSLPYFKIESQFSESIHFLLPYHTQSDVF